jgi:hypothetical protein
MAAKEAHLYTSVIIRCSIVSLEEEEREACTVSKKTENILQLFRVMNS